MTVSKHLNADPETVFRAWTTSEGLIRWYAPVDGWIVSEATVQRGVGGGYLVRFGPAPSGDRYCERGTYSVYDFASRLAWDGSLMGPDEESLSVDVTFTAAAGGTTVTVLESGIRFIDVAREHERGWSEALRQLEVALALEDVIWKERKEVE